MENECMQQLYPDNDGEASFVFTAHYIYSDLAQP
jgi:hypothetical protein